MGILIYWKFKHIVLNDRQELEKCLKSLGALPSSKAKKYKGKAGETYLDLLPKKQIICAEQLSRLFARIVQEQANGISLKLGIYFVKTSMLPNLKAIYTIVEVLRLPFEIFQMKVDPESSIEVAVRDEIMYKLEILKEDIQKKLQTNALTTKALENKQIEFGDLLDLTELYKTELGDSYVAISTLLNDFQNQIKEATDQSKNLLNALRSSF
jgi:hypothetical protein